MERLTRRDETGQALLASEYSGKYTALELMCTLLDRLAAYEDTGLEPEEICKSDEILRAFIEHNRTTEYPRTLDWLLRITKAEAEGRLLFLPCKTVFEPTWDAGKDCDLVCPVLIGGEECCGLCEKAELFVYERPCKQDDIDRLGKSVFRTREEAEAALKGAEE